MSAWSISSLRAVANRADAVAHGADKVMQTLAEDAAVLRREANPKEVADLGIAVQRATQAEGVESDLAAKLAKQVATAQETMGVAANRIVTLTEEMRAEVKKLHAGSEEMNSATARIVGAVDEARRRKGTGFRIDG
jgi:hypothetical protein